MTPMELRAWRKSRGLIQRDAAALLGIVRRTYLYQEQGKTRGGYTIATIPRLTELAIKGLDMEMGVGRLPEAEWRKNYAKAIVALEEASGYRPTTRPMPAAKRKRSA